MAIPYRGSVVSLVPFCLLYTVMLAYFGGSGPFTGRSSISRVNCLATKKRGGGR